ncbi:hypothetical protein I7I48_11392 [Histoplasma ohiense]|nr:hypothetical protein I7I48_11392 [Histoplasma ohiense (nom. inval.)]
MSHSLQKPAALPRTSSSDTAESLWRKAKEKLHISKKESGDAEEEGTAPDTSKSAYARRREQVRRAQRNHRERKEQYIKSLEHQLHRLRDESSSLQSETHQVAEENTILRDIVQEHGLPLPSTSINPSSEDRQPYSKPMATVSVIGSRGFGQRLQVSLGDSPMEPVFPVGFGIPDKPPADKPVLSVINYEKRGGLPSPRESTQLASQGLSQQPIPGSGHPYGLDTTQVGVDFVLFMERCCIYHVHQLHDAEEPNGHAFTALAPLLTQAPTVLDDCTSWQIPASELDRLLELSSALHLDGELTPVEMWMRIKQHPLFHKLNREGLQQLSQALIAGVQCFGFGATFEEQFFASTLEEFFGTLKE